MRRARITATANIPVRRKFQAENAKKLEKAGLNEEEKKDDEKVNTNSSDELHKKEAEQKSNLVDNKIADERITNKLDQDKSSEFEKTESKFITNLTEITSAPEVKKAKIIENTEVKLPITTNKLSNCPSKPKIIENIEIIPPLTVNELSISSTKLKATECIKLNSPETNNNLLKPKIIEDNEVKPSITANELSNSSSVMKIDESDEKKESSTVNDSTTSSSTSKIVKNIVISPSLTANTLSYSLSKPKTVESIDIKPPLPTIQLPASSSKLKTTENIEKKQPITTNELSNSSSKSITNRVCFMRPVPRLDGAGRIRRNSIQGSGASASESEDDIRRNTTQINPSKSSDNPTQSSVDNETNSNNNINNNISNNTSGGNSKINTKQKRKVVISESTRKLAEARREFQIKHENKQPDRTKLTMYDLIYYNPATNPMKKNTVANEPPSINKAVVETNADEHTEEEVDDPPEDAMPVPQVKVGPDGQLIIDEQSLVIERTGLKKNREALAKRQAVVDDDNNFGGGFYKRRKRVKEWPKWETIKFYKALSAIGTDFLLMQTLFPKRSRQEIKLKFKKEEKLNRKLVEKALSCKLDFDVDGLKQELDTFEELEECAPKPQPQTMPTPKMIKRQKLSRRIAVTSLGEAGEDGYEREIKNDEKPNKRKRRVPRKRVSYAVKKPTKLSTASTTASLESDCDGCDEIDSDSGSEIYRPRRTRSGRTPKIKNKIRAKHILDSIFINNSSEEIATEENGKNVENPQTAVVRIGKSIESSSAQLMTLETIETSVPDINSVEPGSLLIVSNESADEPGKTVVQVYMVKSNVQGSDNTFSKTLTPVNIETENLSPVTNELKTISTISDHET